MVSPFMPDTEKVAAIRQLLPATGAGIYLNAGSVGPLPAETAAAMAELTERELQTGRGHPDYFEETLERLGEARAAVAAILATDVDAIALTHSATDALNSAVAALRWQRGDRVVTTDQEHPGGLGPLIALRDRLGVELGVVEVAGLDDDEVVDAFERALRRPVRAIVFSHVLWTTGARLPVARIAAAARAAGTWVVVDGAQAVGAIPIAVDDLGADFYATSGYKWLLGPEGMGALWASDRAVGTLVPGAGGFLSFAEIDRLGKATWHPTAQRFEATFFHRPSILGLARSCGWLSMYIGLPWALDRAASMTAFAVDRLAPIPGVTVLTPRERSATLVTFRIAGWPADLALAELADRLFVIARTVPDLDALRVSVGFWSTEEELERFAGGVELLAAHTPATLPPRRRLTVLGSDDRPIG